jgi:hypothetical protein
MRGQAIMPPFKRGSGDGGAGDVRTIGRRSEIAVSVESRSCFYTGM